MPPSRGWRSAAMQCVWKPRRSAVGIDGIWIWNQTCFWCQDFCQDPILIRWCSPIAQASDCWCDIEGVIQSFSNIIGQTDESALNWPRLCKLWETLVRVCFLSNENPLIDEVDAWKVLCWLRGWVGAVEVVGTWGLDLLNCVFCETRRKCFPDGKDVNKAGIHIIVNRHKLPYKSV